MEYLPIVLDIWRLKLKTGAAKQFKIIRELTAKVTTVVNIGNPDSERQLFFDKVLDFVVNKKPVQKILLNALDEKSVKEELLANWRDNTDFQN